ncbi:Imm50 family immunity protein [Gilliamella sp. wkB112]|uniref:Imm50 family immunity protein n=1 Tax=Gilliamella sp. wkB112 TaxID=3120257 RepID=UPI00080DFC1D|nr:Imm50 family immunity protein [Gilliamella apicola]OCG00874.1 hypothetical protein A9G12_03690 [Gilliamella apicola]
MNIIDQIERNMFLEKVFPNGLDNNLLIGNLDLRLDGNLLVDIHTLQKPHIEISKWGTWNKDYNVIVIKILCSGLSEMHITNWVANKFSAVNFFYKNNRYIISSKEENSSVSITCSGLTFQECNTYIL